MVDPISLAAITAVVTAVGAGMANEAGRTVWESVGGLARRISGREVSAPSDATERAAVARLLHDGARADPAHARAVATLVRAFPGPADAVPAPRRLPPSPRSFTDRREALRLLDQEARRPHAGRPRVAQLYGPEGIGTSTLAHHHGSRRPELYPDGTLYADLRGGGTAGSVPDATTVLRRLLTQLLVPGAALPRSEEVRAELFQSLVADRRMLVVLDHAHSAAQVRPLLTSAPGVFTLIVARRALTGIDALPIPVGPLPARDARRLLVQLLAAAPAGPGRAALAQLVTRCAGSPYALNAAAAARLARAGHPDRPAGQEDRNAVAEPDPADDPVLTAIDDAYRALPADAALLHRLLALWPWPALGAGAAAATARIPEAQAAELLRTLADRRLLEPVGGDRYRQRPAVRRHARAEAARLDGFATGSAALTRTVAWYLHHAVAADRAALPQRWHVSPLFDRTGPGPAPYANPGQALAALGQELPNLVAAALAAAEADDHDTVCTLAEALWAAQLKLGRHDEVLPVLRAAVRAARQKHPGTRVEGRAHTQLALALTEAARYEEAETELTAAAEADRCAGHARGRATAVETLGLLRLRQWRFAEAYEHFEEAARILSTIGADDDGYRDVPRARALLERHRGRALLHLGRTAEARDRLGRALDFFRATHEAYNTARTLGDLAQTHIETGDRTAALPLLDEAIRTHEESEEFHLARLRALRAECVAEPEG